MSAPTQIFGIDCWQDDPNKKSQNDIGLTQLTLDDQYDYLKKLEALDDRITIIRDFSLNAVKLFKDNSVDYCYLDADHSLEAITQDINQWYSKIKSNGLLSGHDYTPGRVAKRCGLTGVKLAVDNFVKEHNIKYFHITKEKFSSWIILKT
jgi:hypothetical protein